MNYEHDSLTLGLGFPSTTTTTTTTIKPTTTTTTTVKPLSCNLNEPSLTLSLLGGEAAPCSAASSMSNVVVSVKRERESGSNTSDELDNIDHRGYSRGGSDEEEDGGCHVNATRKKLRLNKQQSAMLEESFKQQSTLNPKQKQALADRLNLRPRQVEVWFQNRRARTKLKQTEVDCEYLKKYCETLSDENMKLQKEVQELKALKSAQPFYMHLPAATLTMCPSCERIGTGPPNNNNNNNIVAPTTPANNNNPFSMGPKTHRFFTSVPTRPLLVDN